LEGECAFHAPLARPVPMWLARLFHVGAAFAQPFITAGREVSVPTASKPLLSRSESERAFLAPVKCPVPWRVSFGHVAFSCCRDLCNTAPRLRQLMYGYLSAVFPRARLGAALSTERA
jgi:hypothetical protein